MDHTLRHSIGSITSIISIVQSVPRFLVRRIAIMSMRERCTVTIITQRNTRSDATVARPQS